MPVRIPRENNPFYPLPADYERLTGDGQYLARMNALMLGRYTPEDLVYSWSFFRNFYLRPDEVGWYKRWKESPPHHYQLIYDMGQFSANAEAAPRAFAKSTVCNEGAMLLTLLRPNFATSLIRATAQKSRKNMARIKRQLETNKYLNDDFSKFYGQALKPARGARVWSTEMLELPNGSSIEGTSINSALRGDRPDLIIIDDPEYDEDEEKEGRSIQLLEDFEDLLFKTILGMLEDGTGLFWIGTLISRKSFLYHICRGDDPRFDSWNRRVLSVVMPDGSLLWEQKWDAQTVRDRRKMLGESAFNSEMMNEPGAGSEKTLVIHPELCTYRVEGPPPERERDPLSSQSVLSYTEARHDDDRDFQVQRTLFGPWVSRLYRMALVDYAPTISPASDYSCVLVLGFDPRDCLWLLDGWVDKVRADALERKVWDLAYRWKVRAIGVEAVSVQKHLADRIATDLAKTAQGTGYVPRVIPITYPGRNRMSKGERIQGLEWRFNQFKIKYPVHRQHEYWVSQLFYQTENFTPDLTLLRHDDIIDTVAMHQYLLRRPGSKAPAKEAPRKPLDFLAEGITTDEKSGLQYGLAVPLGQITDAVLDALRRHADGFQGEPCQRRTVCYV